MSGEPEPPRPKRSARAWTALLIIWTIGLVVWAAYLAGAFVLILRLIG
jgi:hypothetical protein